jgi:hypothetical protein
MSLSLSAGWWRDQMKTRDKCMGTSRYTTEDDPPSYVGLLLLDLRATVILQVDWHVS